MPFFFCQSTSLSLPKKTQNSIRWSCSFPFFVVFVQSSEFPEFWVNIQSWTIVNNNGKYICHPKPSTSIPRPVLLVMAAGGDSGSRSSKQTCRSAGRLKWGPQGENIDLTEPTAAILLFSLYRPQVRRANMWSQQAQPRTAGGWEHWYWERSLTP